MLLGLRTRLDVAQADRHSTPSNVPEMCPAPPVHLGVTKGWKLALEQPGAIG
jgi:hypothetical protein